MSAAELPGELGDVEVGPRPEADLQYRHPVLLGAVVHGGEVELGVLLEDGVGGLGAELVAGGGEGPASGDGAGLGGPRLGVVEALLLAEQRFAGDAEFVQVLAGAVLGGEVLLDDA